MDYEQITEAAINHLNNLQGSIACYLKLPQQDVDELTFRHSLRREADGVFWLWNSLALHLKFSGSITEERHRIDSDKLRALLDDIYSYNVTAESF